MYNLRSRKPLLEQVEEEVVPPVGTKRPQQASNTAAPPAKRSRFDPRQYQSPADWDYDSSDSESDDDVLPSEEEEPSEDLSDPSEDDEEDDDEDNSSDPSEEAEVSPLVTRITARLSPLCPGIDREELVLITRAVLEMAQVSTEAKDTSWKRGLSAARIEELEPLLEEVRTKMDQQRPQLATILAAPLSMTDRVRAVRYYDSLMMMKPNTLGYWEMVATINSLLGKESTPPGGEAIYRQLQEQIPTLQQILSARLTERDRLQGVQLYEMLQTHTQYSDRWVELKEELEQLLSGQFVNEAEQQQIEKQEQELRGVVSNFERDLKRHVAALEAPPLIKSRIYEMVTEALSHSSTSDRRDKTKEKLRWLVRLPFQRIHPITASCAQIHQRLEQRLYGMTAAKEQILQAVNDRLHNPGAGTILALKGKPGVGKTKLCRTVAEALGVPFGKINLGGAIDSTQFKGSDSVWSGASPSQLLQILAQTGCANCVILLDEIDKLGTSSKGLEVQNSLLHVLDPSQNAEFRDDFLSEIPHDLSKIWFIAALNDDAELSPMLRDRLLLVELPSYSRTEMKEIVIRHTLPGALQQKGLSVSDVTITEEAVNELLQQLEGKLEQGGMRPVEQAVNDLISKISLLQSLGEDAPLTLSFSLPDFTGYPYQVTPETIKTLFKPASKERSVGLAMMYL